MECIYVTRDNARWQTIVNTVMNRVENGGGEILV
jgi:hypothetical protein